MKYLSPIATLFGIGFLATWCCLSYLRAWMTWSGDCFDTFGHFWIVLKSIWYGLVTLLVGLCFFYIKRHSQIAVLLGGFGISLLLCDIPDENDWVWNRSLVDRGISAIGYFVAETFFPYHALDTLPPDAMKPAIPPNSKVCATTPLGAIQIESGRGLMRTITWDGVSSSITPVFFNEYSGGAKSELFCFPAQPEQYSHGARFERHFWKLHKGFSRCFYSEVRKYFRSEDEAVKYLKGLQEPCMPGIYNNHGLYVSWSAGVNVDSVCIEVCQVLINGKEPHLLTGANDGKLTIMAK